MARLQEKYVSELVPALKEKLDIGNRWRVPKCTKIVVNMGMGVVDKDQMKASAEELGMISGQKPVITKARKSISNFKLREGMGIGAKVTLRGERMYEFLDRLINAALPRIRDFRGLSTGAFDGHGNFTLGIKDQTIFPEIDPNHAGAIQGMDITIVTSAASDREALELLRLLGMPFADKESQQ